MPVRRRCLSSSAFYSGALAWKLASTSARCDPCGLHKQSVKLSRFAGELTGDEGLLVQLVEPVFTNVDGFCLLVLPCNGVPLLIGVFDKLCDVLTAYGVHDVEEVVPVGQAALWQLVREELHEELQSFHLWPQLLHADLVVVGHVYKPHLAYGHEHLLLGQDLLEEVFVEHCVIRQVELHYTVVKEKQNLSEGPRVKTRRHLQFSRKYLVKSYLQLNLPENSDVGR